MTYSSELIVRTQAATRLINFVIENCREELELLIGSAFSAGEGNPILSGTGKW